jgi:rod shape-determining protein MreC
VVVWLALLGAAVALFQPARQLTLAALRFPFQVLSGSARLLAALPRLPTVHQEVATLRADLLRSRLEAAQLRDALRSAQRAQALQRLVPPDRAGLIATVIGRSLLPPQHTILLDKGSRDGMTLQTAILDGSGLIGRVVELWPDACLVMLLTDPDSRIGVMVERTREIGLLLGEARGMLRLVYLDADAQIEPDDRLITAGLGGPFPKGLPVGRVLDVRRDELSGTAWATVAPAAQLGRLEEVLCLPPDSTDTPRAPAARAGLDELGRP